MDFLPFFSKNAFELLFPDVLACQMSTKMFHPEDFQSTLRKFFLFSPLIINLCFVDLLYFSKQTHCLEVVLFSLRMNMRSVDGLKTKF